MANPVYFYLDDNHFECESCEVAIHDKETFQLLEHTLAFHDVDNVVTECTICTQEFIGLGNIFQHIKNHIPKIQYDTEENIFKEDSKVETEVNDQHNEKFHSIRGQFICVWVHGLSLKALQILGDLPIYFLSPAAGKTLKMHRFHHKDISHIFEVFHKT